MLMQKSESEFGAPAGIYQAEFLGTFELADEKPRLGRDGKPMPPAIEWRFKIVAGKFASRIVSRITSKRPTAKNSCGVLLDGVAGRSIAVGEGFDPDSMVGQVYQVVVDKSATNPDRTQVASVFRSGPSATTTVANSSPPKDFAESGF
jgi:hypothetical protein